MATLANGTFNIGYEILALYPYLTITIEDGIEEVLVHSNGTILFHYFDDTTVTTKKIDLTSYITNTVTIEWQPSDTGEKIIGVTLSQS